LANVIAVKLKFCGKRVGCYLNGRAIRRATEQGYKRFQLDVLAMNPVLGFYRALGLQRLTETSAAKSVEFGAPAEYRIGMNLWNLSLCIALSTQL
jgi:hypothetical protein